MPGHACKNIFILNVKNMTTVYKKLKRKGRAPFFSDGFKASGWWIERERGLNAPPN
jgi:hypothetical protein